MIESVRVAMRPGLLPESERRALWKKSARKTPYLVGFIAAAPNDLPDRMPQRSDLPAVRQRQSMCYRGGKIRRELLVPDGDHQP